MSNVFAFEWCSCIYESGFSLVSLHDTKRGALKAMIAAANIRWQESRDGQLMYGGGGKERFDPLQYEAWRVRTIELHNTDAEPMTTAKTMQDNGTAPPAVGSRLDRRVRAVRYGWTPSGMIEDYSGPWIAASELDCRTCRNFRGTRHCHSVLRCVDGSSYQRGGAVQLWETAPVDAGF